MSSTSISTTRRTLTALCIAFSLWCSTIHLHAQDTYPPGTYQLTPADDLGLEPVPLLVPDHFKHLLPADPILQLPPGFSVKVFAAAGLAGPRMMAWSPEGVLHVANMRRYNYNETNSAIVALPDRDQDGLADTVLVVADGLRMVNSLAFYKGDLYAATTDQILRLTDADGDGFYEQRDVLAEIPSFGQHLTRTLLFDEINDKLYVAIGSSCNVCRESRTQISEKAGILQFNADGSGRRIFARGLRNAVGIALHPVTNELWATNNGHDQDSYQNGDTLPPEWTGIVRDGGFYGWPLAYGFQAYIDFSIGEFKRDIFPISSRDSLDVASMTRPEVMLPAHSAPMGIHFYDKDLFPPRYHQAAFIAIHAGNRGTELGYKVVTLFAEPNGSNARLADFMTGFRTDPNDRASWGTPMDIIADAQGNLFVSNDNLFIGSPGFILKIMPPHATAIRETRSAARPDRFRLEQNIPNPFNGETAIGFDLIQDGSVELAVYNLAGQRVAILVDEARSAGKYAVQWDGRDDAGRTLASGVYLYRLRAGQQVETRKLLLLQ